MNISYIFITKKSCITIKIYNNRGCCNSGTRMEQVVPSARQMHRVQMSQVKKNRAPGSHFT